LKTLAVPRFLKGVPAARRAEVFAVMQQAAAAFGQPHLHAGLGLRRVPPFMECRCGLDLRLVFRREGDALVFFLCGTHDQVKAFLKNRR
jgi:hypothetical protein